MTFTPETTLACSPWPFLAPPESKGEIGRLAGYRVLKLLGKGGMGMVFQAEDPALRRLVALKVMLPDVAAGEQSRERFLREARAAAALKHDHVVTIYQVGEDRGVQYLAMEFLKGKSLADWLASGKQPTVAETLLIGRQIAKGLAAAHQAGLVHRDIKPANLWLEAPAGRVKILDFGLARTSEHEASPMTEQGAVVGTPAFMAPEQARGQTVTAQSDLFSLGCVLYRLATGKMPFAGDTLVAVLSAVLSQAPRSVRELNPEVPERLANLIGRLLAKEPNQRPASAQEVQEELAAIGRELKGTSDTARLGVAETIALDTASVKSGAPLSRGWLIVAGCTAALALLVVAGVGTGAYFASKQPDSPPATSLADVKPTTDNEPDLVSADEPLAIAPQPPAAGDSIDLLALVDVPRDQLQGNWYKQDEDLIGWTRKGPYTFVLPWAPPDEYRLKMTVVRSGGGHLSLGLESSNTRFLLLIGFANRERQLTGLAMWDDVPLAKRPDVRFGKVFAPSIPVEVVVTVKKESLLLTLAGREVYSLQGNLTRAAMPLAPGGSLVIGGGGGGDGVSSFRFESITLEPLGTDRGRPLHASEPAKSSD